LSITDTTSLGPIEGPPVERIIVRDMLRRGWPALLLLVALGAFWGLDGIPSAAFGVAVAVANACLAAAMVSSAARVSLTLVYVAALGGYLLRLGLITVAVLAFVQMDWVEVVPLSFALVIAHLGLFVWEARFVSTQLAFPGLKPAPGGAPPRLQSRQARVEKGAP
jgi:hypothetical protein